MGSESVLCKGVHGPNYGVECCQLRVKVRDLYTVQYVSNFAVAIVHTVC